MASPYVPYELAELLESSGYGPEYDESEPGEAVRRPRQPVRTASRGNPVPQRPEAGYATKAELTATANRLDARIAVNSSAIKTVEGRVNAVAGEQGKLKGEITKLQSGLNDVRSMSMLLPLLSSQKTITTSSDVAGIPKDSKVVVDNGDNFSRVLPLLLFSGGLGGSSGSGGSQSGGLFGGDSGGLMTVALLMAMQK